MPFDPLVANAGRLRILTALAVEERQEFVHLRSRTQLTDGNLAAHLQSAGLIAIDKQFREGKPVTSYLLTAEGRRALESHARRLVAAISQRRLQSYPADGRSVPGAVRVANAPAASASTHDRPAAATSSHETITDAHDDWVD